MFKNKRNKNEKGQGLVEYALILVLVSIVVIVAATALGPQIGDVFSDVNAALGGGGGGASVGPQGEDFGVSQAYGDINKGSAIAGYCGNYGNTSGSPYNLYYDGESYYASGYPIDFGGDFAGTYTCP